MGSFPLCLLALLTLLTTGRAADTNSVRLHLRNGDVVTGTVLRDEGGRITVSNAVLGQVTLGVASIARREHLTNSVVTAVAAMPGTNTPSVATTTNAAALQPGAAARRRLNELLAAYLSGEISPEGYHRQRLALLAEAGMGPAAAAATASAMPRKPAGPRHWSGEAQLGADLGFSQKERQLYTARLKLNYARDHVRNTLDYLATYGRTDGDLSANRMDGTMKTDYDLKRGYYLYSLTGAGFDEIRKIDWRYEIGPGLGYNVVKLTNFVFRLEGGFHYEVQEFQGNTENENYYHRLAQDLKWNLGTIITLDEKMEYLPQLADLRDYKLRVEANVKFWLRSNLYFNLTVINLYDTVTAKGVGQNDLQLRSTIGVRF